MNYETQIAKLFCVSFGYSKETTTSIIPKSILNLQIAAHSYFNADLWLKASYKNEVF